MKTSITMSGNVLKRALTSQIRLTQGGISSERLKKRMRHRE